MNTRMGSVTITTRILPKRRDRMRQNARQFPVMIVPNVPCVRLSRLLALRRGQLNCRLFPKPHRLLWLQFVQTLNWVLVCRFRPVLRQLRELISAWTGLFECLRDSIAAGFVLFVLLVGYEHFLLAQRIHNNATERAIRHQAFEFQRSPV